MNCNNYIDQVSNIFVLSDSFLRIKELVDDEASTIDDISEVIMLDPALAGTILKLANSSFFNYPGKIDTISKAVLVLGITEVYTLVIAHFTTEAFQSLNADDEYLEHFWLKSVDCALLLKFLGSSLRVANAERLFILGLLHNLGELVVQQVNPELVVACDVFDLAELPWQKQRAALGFSYGECSAELLKQWQIPYSLFAPIRDQDVEAVTQYSLETQLLYIAKRVMTKNVMVDHQALQAMGYEEFVSPEVLAPLGVTEGVLSNAVDYCQLERMGMLSILCPSATMLY